ADRIVVMNKGRIEQVGKPLDLYYQPANLFVAGFIGSPSMNLIPATIDRRDGRSAMLSSAVTKPLRLDLPPSTGAAGASVTIGIRPEHLRPDEPGDLVIETTIDVVERLGETSYAYSSRADGAPLIVELRGKETPAPGST